MFSENKKYLFFLIVIIVLLPAGFVALFELSGLQKNEEVIEQVYKEQLDAILFSVNQYSDDILSSTIREIGFSLQENEDALNEVLTNQSFVKEFFFLQDSIIDNLSDKLNISKQIKSKAKWILTQEKNTIIRLQQFFSVGYFRLEPFSIENTDLVLFLFIIQDETQYQPAIIVVDALSFIEERLDPQIQKVAGEQFNIAVLDKSDTVVYHSNHDYTNISVELTSPLRAFTEFNLGISLQGETISELVQKRTKRNIYFVSLVSIVLLLAGWLVIRILSKQIELASLKSEFVSNVSHEIRTPLSLINMYAETIDMGRVTSEKMQKDYVKTILLETTRLSVLVNKILNFSQIEKNKKQYTFEKANLNVIVLEIFKGYIPYLEKLGFTHKIELNKDIPEIRLDKESIKDVLINLLDNAIKYSLKNKAIVVRTGMHANKIYLEIEDQGIGLKEKDKKYIFEKFYRVSNNDVSIKVKGSGLGLSIVKHIINGHNGKIEIKSKLEKGSTFRILFRKNN